MNNRSNSQAAQYNRPSNYINQLMDDYLRDGTLWRSLRDEITIVKVNEKYGKSTILNEKQKNVYARFTADLKEVKKMLKNIVGNDKENCSFEKKVQAQNGYTFERTEWLGRHFISINRDRDRFYWTIGVAGDGDVAHIGNDVNIVAYYHVGTNGSLQDLQEAFAATKHLFPKTNPHRYELCSEFENTRQLFSQLRWPSNVGITHPFDYSPGRDKNFIYFQVVLHEKTEASQIPALEQEKTEFFVNQIKKLYPEANITCSDMVGPDGKEYQNVIRLKASDMPVILSVLDEIKAASKAAAKANRMWQAKPTATNGMPCDKSDKEMAKSDFGNNLRKS